jgi:hypothetical protein
MKGTSAVEETPHWFSMYSPFWESLLNYKRGDPGQGRGALGSKKIQELENELGSCILSSSCTPTKYTKKQDATFLPEAEPG